MPDVIPTIDKSQNSSYKTEQIQKIADSFTAQEGCYKRRQIRSDGGVNK
jgi:hypothetical protein